MADMPVIDSRTREMLFEEMRISLKDKGIKINEDDGEILSTLVFLYSDMLADTITRLNKTPEKHRAAFLNLAHTPPRPAWPGSGFLAFEVADGYDDPVEISRGTRVAADSNGQPISFRLRSDLMAIPARITDVYWNDPVRGRYGCSQSLSELRPWNEEDTREFAYKADFIFENIFCGHNEVVLFVEAMLQERPVPLSELIHAFRWSISPWPQDEPEFTSLSEIENPDGGLYLQPQKHIEGSEYARIRMELIDPAYEGLCVRNMYLMQLGGFALPDAIHTSSRGLEPDAFYPFGSPLRAFEECGVFCDVALSQKSAEIKICFNLKLELSEEWPTEPEDIIDYKWIMRKPLPKPRPIVYNAFAKSVRLEYWDGSAYKEIRGKSGRVLDFTHKNPRVELSFMCPENIVPCEYFGKPGYHLRLSCAECDELYKLPRRVYTPYISGLKFFYSHDVKYTPLHVEAESFGRRGNIDFDSKTWIGLFERHSQDKTLLLGFDRLMWKCRLKMYFDIENTVTQKDNPQKLKASVYSNSGYDILSAHDFTDALTASGSLWIDIPENAVPTVLFGKERYWVALTVGEDTYPTITAIHMNVQLAENRTRFEENFPYSHLRDNRLTLTHGNIMRVWVYVRSLTDDKMELWREYETTDGKFRTGFYKIDYINGLITFPYEMIGRSISDDMLDLIRVVYDATDGNAANLPAGSITRTEEDLPFIKSVRNIFTISNGAGGESGEELAIRKRHAFYNGGRIVSRHDFELFAVDNCPLVSDAKCTYDADSKTVVLAVRIKEEVRNTSFAKIKSGLLRHLRPLISEGIDLDIIPWEVSL